MKILVKNDDPIKAYRVLMKKLLKDGWVEELRKRQHYTPSSLRKKLKHKAAVLELKKIERRKVEAEGKEEQRMFVEAKKRGREARKRKQEA